MFPRIQAIISSLNTKELRTLYSALSFLILSLVLLGINSIYKNTILIPNTGGEYIEGFIGQPSLINPILITTNDIDRDLTALLFSDLGILTEKIESRDHGQTWIITLKKEMWWSDGEPITANDIIYTLNTIQDFNTRSPLLTTWQGVIAEKLSDSEIKFTLKAPYVYFDDNLKSFKIIPHHIFNTIPNANLKLSNYNLEPISSGPYMFKASSKRKDGFITDYYLIPNVHYIKRKPYITNLHLKFFSSGAEAVKNFNKLEITGIGGLDYQELNNLKVGYQAYSLSMPRYYALFLNQSVNMALKEPNVRKALSLATNKNKIIQDIFHDTTEIVTGPFTKSIKGFDKSIYTTEQFSIENAQKILDESGWKIGEDGIAEKQYGRGKLKLEFEIVVPQIKFLIDTVDIIKNDWAKIGIKLLPIIMTPQEINDSIIKTRNYQIIIFGNILKNNPDVFAFWHSSERFHPGLNLSVYENKTVDKLLENIRKDPNETSRQKSLSKLQSIILTDTPAIFLFSPRYLYITSKNLKGFSATSTFTTPSDRFTDIANWHLNTKRVFK